jgi:hypothetical protein
MLNRVAHATVLCLRPGPHHRRQSCNVGAAGRGLMLLLVGTEAS